MSKAIPEHVDLLRAARQDGHFSGPVEIAKMPRFAEYLAAKKGQVDVDIQLCMDAQGHARLRGSASATVQVLCQRCMQAMPFDIAVTFDLILLEEAYQLEALQDDVDALVIETVPTSLYSIIEDELILGFSLVPMHEQEACEASVYMHDREQQPVEQEQHSGKPNPFTALKDLKLDG